MLTQSQVCSQDTSCVSPLTLHVSTRVADRLYQVADRLADDWREAGLDDTFASRTIVAVLRFLEKVGRRRADGVRRSDEEQADFAEALLRQFWMQNARRDAARVTQRREEGRQPRLVPMELVGEHAAVAELYHPLRDDLQAGETGRFVARFLEGLGWPRERAWAFVWRESGKEWDDVAFLMAKQFEADTSTARLRKWGERYFEPVMPEVRAFLERHLGLTEDVSHAPAPAGIVSVQERKELRKGW